MIEGQEVGGGAWSSRGRGHGPSSRGVSTTSVQKRGRGNRGSSNNTDRGNNTNENNNHLRGSTHDNYPSLLMEAGSDGAASSQVSTQPSTASNESSGSV